MPKATAVWLVENTALTFEQIADFCNLHPLEVQAIADGEVGTGIQGMDPVVNGELTAEEIERCVADPNARLVQAKARLPQPRAKPKGARYTPVSKRQDRPDAIAWLLKNYPELSDAQISRMIGTTKPTINAVREKTHWNATNIKPQNPVGLGLCTTQELEKIVAQARRRTERERAEKAQALAQAQVLGPSEMAAEPEPAEEPAEGEAPSADEPSVEEQAAEEPVVENSGEERPDTPDPFGS